MSHRRAGRAARRRRCAGRRRRVGSGSGAQNSRPLHPARPPVRLDPAAAPAPVPGPDGPAGWRSDLTGIQDHSRVVRRHHGTRLPRLLPGRLSEARQQRHQVQVGLRPGRQRQHEQPHGRVRDHDHTIGRRVEGRAGRAALHSSWRQPPELFSAMPGDSLGRRRTPWVGNLVPSGTP